MTEHVSEFLDHHLNPLVCITESYVRDTNHFLLLLAGIGDIPDGALLCTVDVVGLYPSIPHDEGLEAMRRALSSRQDPSISTGSLVNLGKVVLENNVFEFGGRIFRQKLGTAIGTKFAPAYANLFMADLEKRLLDGAVDKPLVWLRYIDDVFFIWTHGQSKLDSFLEYLNGFHQTIKFTSESSMEKVSFLDVMVVKKGGILETDLYCKPTDTHQYLQRGSCHPWHVKKAIPYGQALRIRRICSDDGKFLARSKELVGWFKDRGYDEGFVKEQVERVRNLDRQVLIEQDVGRNRGRGDRIPFVVSYHPALNGIRRTVGKLQPMLAVTEEHKRVFPEQPFVAFRRASNLKDSLVRAKLPPVEGGSVKGCFRCGKSRCQVCRFMSEGDRFVCHVTGKEYNIGSRFDCDSSGVVYLLGCKVCGMQYVGSTFTPFRNRFNNYKSSCRKFEKGEMVGQADFYRHFELAGHHGFMEDVGVQVIDRLLGESRVREGFWQFKLDSFAPKGLNVRLVDS